MIFKNLGNSHSHLNLKRIGIRNSHSGVNFQNSIPINKSIQFTLTECGQLLISGNIRVFHKNIRLSVPRISEF